MAKAFFSARKDLSEQHGFAALLNGGREISTSAMLMMSFAFLGDQALFDAFLGFLPEVAAKAMMELAWVGAPLSDREIENRTGLDPYHGSRPEKSAPLANMAEPKVPLGFELFLNHERFDYTYRKPSYFEFFFDEALEAHIRPMLPKPDGLELKPVMEIAGNDHAVFNAEKSIELDWSLARKAVKNGDLKFSQSGKPVDTGFTKFFKETRFKGFGNRKQGRLYRSRAYLLAIFFDIVEIEEGPSIPFHELVKQVVQQEYVNIRTGHFLLTKVKGVNKLKETDWEEDAEISFLELMAEMPRQGWIGFRAFMDFLWYRRDFVRPINKYSLFTKIFQEGNENMENAGRTYIYADDAEEKITAPFVAGNLFLFAALGLVEIAFNEPREYDAASDYFLDSIYAFRPTNLGKYVFGMAETYTPVASSSRFHLSNDSLVVLAEGDADELASQLAPYSNYIGLDRYEMDPAKWLSRCHGKEDLEALLSDFRLLMGKPLPPFWERFFASMLKNALAVRSDAQASVFVLPPSDQALHLRIAKDPVLKQFVLKAEGFRLIVGKADLPRFKERMRELGFLVEG